MVEARVAMRLWASAMRPSAQGDDRTPLGLGNATGMVVGSLAAIGLPGDRADVRTVGLGGMADLPATVLAPDGAQPWAAETARTAGTVSTAGSLSRELRPDQ